MRRSARQHRAVSARVRVSTAEIESCYLSCNLYFISLRLSYWLLGLHTRISILHHINGKCLLNNLCNALYRWVSLTSQRTCPVFPCNEHGHFLILSWWNTEKLVCLWHTERGNLSTGNAQICSSMSWSKKGWRGRNANNLYCFIEDLRAARPSQCDVVLIGAYFHSASFSPQVPFPGNLWPLTAAVFSLPMTYSS